MRHKYDIVIVGSGPAGLAAAFHLIENQSALKILIIEKNKISSGGLRHDCKQNYTYPIGFPTDIWPEELAHKYLLVVKKHLKPKFKSKKNILMYTRRASELGVKLIDVEQSHIGTDKAIILINYLINQLKHSGIELSFEEEVKSASHQRIYTNKRELEYKKVIVAPGRGGFAFLQRLMDKLGIDYIDNIVDIGIRIETLHQNYSIVDDYYDPKFLFTNKVRTFCTNSGAAYVVKENYDGYFSMNGHSFFILQLFP